MIQTGSNNSFPNIGRVASFYASNVFPARIQFWLRTMTSGQKGFHLMPMISRSYWALCVLVILFASTHAQTSDDGKTATDTKTADKWTNTLCPVMVGEEVSSKYFVEYNGQKIYLCCKKCVNKFQKDPDKYVKRVADMKAAAAEAPSANRSSAETSSKAAPADDTAGKSTAKTNKKHEKEEEDDDDDDDKGMSGRAQNRSDSSKDNTQKKSKKHDD